MLSDSIIQGRLSLFQFKFQNLHKIFYALLSNRAIGRQLGVNHQTINNELKRGTVRQIRRQKFNGKTYDYPYHIYSYEAGQNIYLKCH